MAGTRVRETAVSRLYDPLDPHSEYFLKRSPFRPSSTVRSLAALSILTRVRTARFPVEHRHSALDASRQKRTGRLGLRICRPADDGFTVQGDVVAIAVSTTGPYRMKLDCQVASHLSDDSLIESGSDNRPSRMPKDRLGSGTSQRSK